MIIFCLGCLSIPILKSSLSPSESMKSGLCQSTHGRNRTVRNYGMHRAVVCWLRPEDIKGSSKLLVTFSCTLFAEVHISTSRIA